MNYPARFSPRKMLKFPGFEVSRGICHEAPLRVKFPETLVLTVSFLLVDLVGGCTDAITSKILMKLVCIFLAR
jgi:hypothetical protein